MTAVRLYDVNGSPVTCGAFHDDGATRKCSRCGWWRSSHVLWTDREPPSSWADPETGAGR